jgi:beta-galactosidase/beta-glucuronidase
MYKFKNPEVVQQIEDNYPEMTNEYKKIMWEQYETFCLKQSNYGPSNISVGTSLSTPDDVKLSLTGLWFRMNDKIQRLKQLVVLGKQDNVGEAVEDTFQDLSVYGVICQLVSRGKWAK